MGWTEGIEDGAYVVHLSDRLDGASASDFERVVTLVADGNHTKVILDMSDLMYISSAGLRVILLLGKKVRSMKGVLVLAALSNMVHEIFDVSGFLSLFPIANNLEEAKKICSDDGE
ncbi:MULTISPECIES: STAS domain-containing protein [Candidatus Ichthyocystis]|uniref:Anti-sigma factor antagonist n=1 Tax=Candidatus Ichthyocystis hellenicum TaxID=1561003 RepID=A0A0S4M1H3_9BURK|nr:MULTISPECIES: STAS domain-containing protein [Ichthyocystis]CUT17088.1 putative STAS domain protein [Candidatus Ichthyocystis hellenicum]